MTSQPNSASAYPASTGVPAWRDHSSAVPKESTQWPACQASACHGGYNYRGHVPDGVDPTANDSEAPTSS